MDLDGLKRINDQLGHEHGDRAIGEAADVLSASFRESDIVARIGGDEFAALAIGVDPERAPALMTVIEQRIARHNAREGRSYRLGMSLGYSLYDPHHPRSIGELMEDADASMYRNKRSKRPPESERAFASAVKTLPPTESPARGGCGRP
jgi:diguanylate cyclase (GGDEF)-like protein